MLKKMFFKSLQVCDLWGNWLIMLGFMDLKWPRVARHSNVGLVINVTSHIGCFGLWIRWHGFQSVNRV